MKILSTSGFEDYELLDSGDGQRLERYGAYLLARPDPQAIWKPLKKELWKKADAIFDLSANSGQGSLNKGRWIIKTQLPQRWKVRYKDLSFWVKLTPFKHTGIFPEQSIQWDFIRGRLQGAMQPSVLNLFGYTGGATLAAASVGAKVTHVDASRSAISWARENQQLSKLENKHIRWILDDCIKFCQREVKRGVKYEGIVMDPPVYGHGPGGEVWDFNKSFPELLELCQQLLSDNPLFVIVNAYAISSSALMLENMLRQVTVGGEIEVGELAIKEQEGDRLLSTGIFGRWSKS